MIDNASAIDMMHEYVGQMDRRTLDRKVYALSGKKIFEEYPLDAFKNDTLKAPYARTYLLTLLTYGVQTTSVR